MKGYELLKINESLLNKMDELGLTISDVKYVGMMEDFIRMSKDGEKKTYIVQVLSDKYNIAERTIYRVVEKMLADVAV